MKRILTLATLFAILNVHAYAPKDLVWTSMSHDSSGSMPVGGGDIGMNVWVEEGDLFFYLGRSGAYDENNTLLKQGRVRVRIPGDSLAPFSQTLRLAEGYCEVRLHGARVVIWADVFKPVVNVEIESSRSAAPEVSYETWRYKDRSFRKAEGRQSSWKWSGNKSLRTSRDSITVTDNSVTFIHHNPSETVFDVTVAREGLDSLRSSLWNPLANLASGGRLYGKDLRFDGITEGVYDNTDFVSYNFSTRPARKHTFSIVLNNEQTSDLSAFNHTLDVTASRVRLARDRVASRKWWRDFWNRSYVEAPETGDSDAARITRNYTLFRYMLGCNAYGKEPTKFNGGLFTFDPVHVNPDNPFTPDFRNWGGGTMTAQNQRLVYWPMLKNGDFDMMKPQFDFYLRMLPNAKARTIAYWGHDGACFTEQTELFAFPNMMEYGSKRPVGFDPGVEYNAWLEYCWDTVLEFCDMILQSAVYNGADITEYLPLIDQSLIFFEEHYKYMAGRRGAKKLDGDGKLILFPGSACETYKMTNNASSTIAGLRKVSEDYISYLTQKEDTASANRWRRFLDIVPEIPVRFTADGKEMIAPAKTWERINNIETPQLYPVFPWRIYGVAVDDSVGYERALNTYLYDTDALGFRSTKGWKQDNIWAACLGLVDEAFALNSEKWADGLHRFPAFLGPGYDWTPDHNWAGAAMIGVQEMLLQADPTGRMIKLFPAWPADKDISFRLHAPCETTIEATLKDGQLTHLKVMPESRAKDVVISPQIKKSYK